MSLEREERVRKFLAKKLSDLFDVQEEVEGAWPLDNRTLRLDLLLRPNNKARELGFDVDAIGVEIKDPESKESVKKLLDCVMQSYTYGFCEFDGVRPSFVLIYPGIDSFFDYDWKHKGKGLESEKPTREEKRMLARVMQRANVGELIIKNDHYTFKFAAGPFFHSNSGRSKIQGIGLNRYVGSQKS